ncbi:hypothetical protein JI739_00640 [Ramlibacter sp. AW1]|uniref:Uncharacterized protein n=1 Tax=Ramlibacter aurantiacus TaxID=2801330 RepID=A0A936ZME2_9BURK|nr:hypothetical protein [Ramlibacter aurantiacus]MBL0418841.1 hypothetical protein [Ramlibacter aurantiacus]
MDRLLWYLRGPLRIEAAQTRDLTGQQQLDRIVQLAASEELSAHGISDAYRMATDLASRQADAGTPLAGQSLQDALVGIARPLARRCIYEAAAVMTTVLRPLVTQGLLSHADALAVFAQLLPPLGERTAPDWIQRVSDSADRCHRHRPGSAQLLLEGYKTFRATGDAAAESRFDELTLAWLRSVDLPPAVAVHAVLQARSTYSIDDLIQCIRALPELDDAAATHIVEFVRSRRLSAPELAQTLGALAGARESASSEIFVGALLPSTPTEVPG